MNDSYRNVQKRRTSTASQGENAFVLWLVVILIALVALVIGGLVVMDRLTQTTFSEQNVSESSMNTSSSGGQSDSVLSNKDRGESTMSSGAGEANKEGGSERLQVSDEGVTKFLNSKSTERKPGDPVLDWQVSSAEMKAVKSASNMPGSGSVSGPDSGSDPDFDPDESLDDESAEEFSIAGWVKNQEGELVPDIYIEASIHRLFKEFDGEIFDTSRDRWKAYSDSSGYYSFTGLPNGEYKIRSPATEVYQEARILVRAGVDSADLMLERQAKEVQIHGYVKNTDDEPLGKVNVIPIVQMDRATTTDDQGNYSLSITIRDLSQIVTLRFLLDGYKEQRETRAFKDLQKEQSNRVDAILEASAGFVEISGSVLDTGGSPVEGAAVLLSSVNLKQHYSARSDEAGFFFFAKVEVGEDYEISARHSDQYREYKERNIAFTSDRSDLDIVLEFLGNGRLEGQMINIEGKPVSNFSLWLRSLDVPSRPKALVTGDDSGFFYIDEVPAGKLKMESQVSPYLFINGIELPPGGNLYIQPVIDWGNHRLYGAVLDTEDNPVPQARISLSWSYEKDGLHSSSSRWTTSDAKGYFLFSRLGSGLHRVHASAPGFVNTRVDHTIGFDKDEIRVVLEPEK